MVCMHTKWKKNLRRSSLAALITLALTGSAFAMPSGGAIEQGNVAVSEGNLANVGNGATISTQANSIINWNDFSIGAGETLNFNTAAGALLNRVTSDKVSELLGTMTQTGANPLFVVNPNGIHIGGNATIDAANITLSTLAMSTADFNNAASGRNYALAQSDKGVKAVTIDGGAKIGVGNTLNIYGGKVVVADGVIFNPSDKKTASKQYALIVAGDHAVMWMEPKDGETQPVRLTTTKDNTAEFHGTMNIQRNADIRVVGSSVKMDKAVVSTYGKFEAIAAKQMGYDGNAYREDADASNVLAADNFTGTSGQYSLSGGKVDLKNSSITGSKIEIRGEKDYQQVGDMDHGNAVSEHRAELDNTVTLDHVTLNQQGGGDYAWFYINGGKTDIKNNSEITSTVTGNISAAQYVKRSPGVKDGAKTTAFDWQTTKDNALTVDGGKLTGNTNPAHPDEDSFTLVGSTVDLNHVTVKTNGMFNAGAVQRLYGGSKTETSTAKGNALRANGVNIEASTLMMGGGNVQLKDSTVKVTQDANLMAVKTWAELENDRYNATADVDNVLHLENTKIEAGNDIVAASGTTNFLNGTAIKGDELTFGAAQSHDGVTTRAAAENKVNLWNTKIEGRDVELHAGGAGIWDGSTVDATEKLNADNAVRVDGSIISLERDASSHVRLNGDEATEVKVIGAAPAVPSAPAIPDVPVSPMPSLAAAGGGGSASDAENMATGANAAREALSASKNSVERRENLAAQIRELSQRSPDGRASIGIVAGAIQAIAEASDISNEEKFVLMETAIHSDDTTHRMAMTQDQTTVVATKDAIDVATYVENPMQALDMKQAAEAVRFTDEG
ncbi:MAG: filamentous hemagglutinin N-terminal domain-containing protein [Selenomonas sp.]|nr:filamentous hemagglutinin N-terminal domain-containing protein [Selenomonas sp.]